MAFDAQAAAASQYRKADPTLDDHLQNLSSVFAQQYSPLEYAACSLAHAHGRGVHQPPLVLTGGMACVLSP